MEENNKRILKNTAYLYIRMIVTMALSFISTRIVLDKLGVDDYGIYVLIGGFVSLFTILNNVLQGATRRFMAIAIGKNNDILLRNTFSTSLVMHLIISGIIFLLLESIGGYLVNNTLNIDAARVSAANWVFQFSVLSVVIAVIQTPYTAAVTAHENFNLYAFMSIYDVVAKIVILFLLVYLPFDKLVVYAALIMIVNISSAIAYMAYCQSKYTESSLSMAIDKPLMKEMLKFSGWDSFGNITVILNNQGTTILLNLFFTTAINASRGLANTVTATIQNLVAGFMTASEPQLAKYYAQNDKIRFEKLIFNITQLTLFLLAIIAVPVFFELEFVLQLWLGDVPQYTSEFIKITIITCFIQYSYMMLIKGCSAIGRVKELSLFVSPTSLLNLPLVWLVLYLGWSPTAVYWVTSIPCFLNMTMDLYILQKYADFPARRFVLSVFLKNLILVLLSCIPPYLVQQQLEPGFIRFLTVCTVSVFSVLLSLWVFGLNKDTRQMVLSKFLKRKDSDNAY